jgi:hypothetical protein
LRTRRNSRRSGKRRDRQARAQHRTCVQNQARQKLSSPETLGGVYNWKRTDLASDSNLKNLAQDRPPSLRMARSVTFDSDPVKHKLLMSTHQNFNCCNTNNIFSRPRPHVAPARAKIEHAAFFPRNRSANFARATYICPNSFSEPQGSRLGNCSRRHAAPFQRCPASCRVALLAAAATDFFRARRPLPRGMRLLVTNTAPKAESCRSCSLVQRKRQRC